MFTVTGSAVEAINQLITAQEVQAEGGLRFTLDGAPEVGTALIIDVVARATEGDDVIETAATRNLSGTSPRTVERGRRWMATAMTHSSNSSTAREPDWRWYGAFARYASLNWPSLRLG
jgi:hypothetical protein